MKNASLRILASALAFAAGGAAVAVAQGVPGTTSYIHAKSSSALSPLLSGGSVGPSATYYHSCYATGGVALRNRTTGNISVSGCVTSPFMEVEAAWIYWAVIYNGVPAGSAMKITNTVTGLSQPLYAPAPFATGPSPCWGGTGIAVYRSAIWTSVANNSFFAPTNSKNYQLSLLSPEGNNRDGSDPFVEAPAYPLWEGASIVLIYDGTTTVDVFDTNFAGSEIMLTSPFTYTLNLSGTSPVQTWDNIGADGQVGGSPTGRTATLGTSGETTAINGNPIVGPGPAPSPNSDWDGSSGWPLPQLWDDTGHDIRVAGTTGSLLVSFAAATGGVSFDCMTTVANIVARAGF